MSHARRTAEALTAALDHVRAASSAAAQHRSRGEVREWPSHIKDLFELTVATEMCSYLIRDLAGVAKSCADEARSHYFHGDAPDGNPWRDSVKDAARDADQALSKLRSYLAKAPIHSAHNAVALLHASVQNARRDR